MASGGRSQFDVGEVFEVDPQLFLLRIWAEPRHLEAAPAIYRGRVEHLGAARRRYVKNVEDLERFVLECLQAASYPDGAFEGGRPGSGDG